VAIRAFLHTIWLRRVDLYASHFASSTHLYDCTNATMTCTSKSAHYSSSTYVCRTKMGHEQRVVAIRAFLHTIWLRRVDLYASHFASSTHLYDCTNATMTCTSKSAHYSSSTYVCRTKMGHEQRVVAIRAFLHTIWLRRVDPNSSSLSRLYGGGMSTVDVLPEV
jgi:diketogulonate reductase-like aldo/keto reductase